MRNKRALAFWLKLDVDALNEKFIGFSEKMAWLFYEFIMKAASLKAAINREFWSKIPWK